MRFLKKCRVQVILNNFLIFFLSESNILFQRFFVMKVYLLFKPVIIKILCGTAIEHIKIHGWLNAFKIIANVAAP